MPSARRNRRELDRWAGRLRAGAAAGAVAAGQAVLAAELRRRVPDRRGRLPRLAGAGPAVLVVPPRVGPDGAAGALYVGARFARQVDAALAARGPAALAAMADTLKQRV